jgi:hypothetical protein
VKRLGRALFYGVILLIWVVMAALGLEVWERVHWQRVEKTNPYVLSRQAKGDWPQAGGPDLFSPELMDAAARGRARGAGQSTEPRPVLDEKTMAPRRAAHFALLDDWERYAFTAAYRVKALLVDGRGMVVKAYAEVNYPGGKTPADFVGAEVAARIAAALPEVAAGGPPMVLDAPDGGGWHCVAACPNPGPPGPDDKATPPYAVLCWPDADAPLPDPKSLWDRPFFSYRPHEKREAQKNVLGVSEQFSINNAGLRDDDVILPKPPGVFRVLCMGASTTEEGMSNDLTYPNIVEFLANERFGGQHVDVINAGISGMNSLKHKVKLADYLALEPDLIVTYLAVNDICHDLFPLWVKDTGPRQKRLRESRFLNNHFNAQLLPGEAQMTEDIRRAKMSSIRFIIEQARAAGVETVLCTFAAPAPEKLDRAGLDYMKSYTQLEWGGRYVTFDSYLRALALFNRETAALGGETGAPVIDVAAELRGGTNFFGDICHMKNRGIEAKARLIFDRLAPLLEDRLRQRGLVP